MINISLKEVKSFLDEIKINREFSEFIREKINVCAFSEDQINKLISKTIIPFARENGFDITKEDFEKFVESREFKQLDINDLEEVAGGRNLFAKSTLSMFFCLAEAGGVVSSNVAHAEGQGPTVIQQTIKDKKGK